MLEHNLQLDPKISYYSCRNCNPSETMISNTSYWNIQTSIFAQKFQLLFLAKKK